MDLVKNLNIITRFTDDLYNINDDKKFLTSFKNILKVLKYLKYLKSSHSNTKETMLPFWILTSK